MRSTRIILGSIFIAALLLLSWLDQSLQQTIGPGFILFVGCTILASIAALELARMLRSINIPASPWVLIVAAALGMLATIYPTFNSSLAHPWILLPSAAALVLIVQALDIMRTKRIENAAAALASSQLALVYLGVLPAFYFIMRQDNHILVLLTVILLTKSCDIGAYFVGTAIGKHKLIPWLSPAKSWEGLIGGVALAAILGALAAQLSADTVGIPVWYGALVGITLGLVGQAGDLLESLLKRSTGVKNSGTLPGFGGILDLIDSPLLVAPVAYWLVMLAPAL